MAPGLSADDRQRRLDALDLSPGTPEEFLALMREMLAAAGMTAGQLARSTEMPKSTVYNFVSPTNTALPKHAEQVRLFARGCLLGDHEVGLVLQAWRKLNGTDLHPGAHATANAASDAASELGARLEELKALGESRSDRADRQLARMITDILPTETSLPRHRVVKPAPGPAPTVYIVTTPGGTGPQQIISGEPIMADVGAESLPPARSWQLRGAVLVLLLTSLYPVATTGCTGTAGFVVRILFGLAAPLGLGIGVFPWWGRHGLIPGTKRLAAGVLLGAADAVLTWDTVRILLPALVAGFLVTVAVPLWLIAMEACWTVSFASTRSAITLGSAGWCGVICAAVVLTLGGTVSGAVLGSGVTLAAVMLETAARIMPARR